MEELAIVMNVRLVGDIFLVKRLEICVLMVDAKGCKKFQDDVHWVEGEGFYCKRCGVEWLYMMKRCIIKFVVNVEVRRIYWK